MERGVLLGILSAGAFGAGDFTGGLASRRSTVIVVAAGAQVVGLLLLLVTLLPITRPGSPDPAGLGLGAVAGLSGGLGLLALYRGLSLGSMGLVTALSGVGSVAIPVLVGAVLIGATLSLGQWLGVAAAAAAAALASGATRAGVSRGALGMAGAAAIGFGTWFVFLDLAADHGEVWALLGSRASASALISAIALLVLLRRRPGSRPPLPARGVWLLIAMAGALDVTGNSAFVLATASIPVGVAAALSGLYPLVTMTLARVVLRDAMPPLAVAGFVLAVTGIVLISAG